MRYSIIALGLLAALCQASAQQLVADLNTLPVPNPASSPSGYAQFGQYVVFRATTWNEGAEPWISDGTPGGTRLIADILPGNESSDPEQFVATGNLVFFTAVTRNEGRELWRTDGTSAGTQLVGDARPGAQYADIQWLTALGTSVVFSFGSNDPAAGRELYAADGTTPGVRLVRDIVGGATSSSPGPFLQHQGRLFFSAGSAVGGTTVHRELWVTDGTTSGTALVADIYPGTVGSEPSALTLFGGRVYFRARDLNGWGLWSTDGSAAGTTLVRAIAGPPPLSTMLAAGPQLFFGADGGAGRELWVSDGTAAGTRQVVDLVPGAAGSDPDHLAALGSRCVFTASTASAGREPWISDGTVGGTFALGDLQPGTGSSIEAGVEFVDVGTGFAMFAARTGAQGRELWRTDGSPAGTVLIAELAAGSADGVSGVDLHQLGNRVLFGGGDVIVPGELWTSDGSAAGTALLVDIGRAPAGATQSGLVSAFIAASTIGGLLFRANDGVTGAQVWLSDAVPGGQTISVSGLTNSPVPYSLPPYMTVGNRVFDVVHTPTTGYELYVFDRARSTLQILDLLPGPASSNPAPLWSLEGRLLFAARGASTGTELWTSDGTAAGTIVLADINPGTGDGASNHPGFALRDQFLFSAYRPNEGWELWRTNGTVGGTVLVRELVPGSAGSIPRGWARFDDDNVCFIGDSPAGWSLWITDGTSAGTRQLSSGVAVDASRDLTVAGGLIYFMANDATRGMNPWVSDGTAIGTRLLLDVVPGTTFGDAKGCTAAAGKVFFIVSGTATSQTNFEPWVTDGTSAGTMPLGDLNPGPSGSMSNSSQATGAAEFVPVGDSAVLFTAWDDAEAFEPYVSDGTPAGTHRVIVYPGPWNSITTGNFQQVVTRVGKRTFFEARSPSGGVEAWVTDGTVAGTLPATDIWPGPSSGVLDMPATMHRGRLLLSADDGVHGGELWVLPRPGASVQPIGDACGPMRPSLAASVPTLGSTCTLSGRDAPVGGWLGVVVLGLPTHVATEFPPGCFSIVDQAAIAVHAIFVPGSRTWSVGLSVPNVPLLDGVAIAAQTWFLAGASGLQIQQTNGVYLGLGH